MARRKEPKHPRLRCCAILACVQKNDPARFRRRTVESEETKLVRSRARRKQMAFREERNEV